MKNNAKNYQIRCPYCNSPAVLRPASAVHGIKAQPHSYLYVCSRYPACDSYVSAHQRDKRPMGTLADSHLRRKRIQAHNALEQLRKAKHMEKWAVYVWLQARLGLDESSAHIGLFSAPMCDRLVSVCRQSIKESASQAM